MGEEEKYDCWGLSLSLKPPVTLHDDLVQKPMISIGDQQIPQKKKPSNGTLMVMPKIMGFKVKPITPMVVDLEEVELGPKVVSSPNSTVSSASGKRPFDFSGEREMVSDGEDGGGGGGGGGGGSGGERGERKKLRLSKEQIMVLEQAFREHTTLNTKQKVALARQVNLRPRQVEVWFQNRRARTKLKQTEVDCEYLRRFCETLTEQNKKLQKEMQELKASKVGPGHSAIHANHPPTTLTKCPSCKNVSLSSSSSTTAKTPTCEMGRFPAGGFHQQQVPLSLKKLTLTINSNRVFESSRMESQR